MDLLNKIFNRATRKIFATIGLNYKVVVVILLPLLLIPVVSSLQPIHSKQHTGFIAFMIAQPTKANNAATQGQTIDTAKGPGSVDDSILVAELENTLARKAMIGQRKTGTEDDRFSTILFYTFSIGFPGLIAILIYFYINLKFMEKHVKLLRRRMENIRLRKKAGS